jgi:hypothetical protein
MSIETVLPVSVGALSVSVTPSMAVLTVLELLWIS